MKKLGIGVVGLGAMGHRHAENFRQRVPEARLVAVADVVGARARETAKRLEVEHSHESLEALVENKDVDAVVIATPDKFHAAAVMMAARAGKAILCEKPPALTVEDAVAALKEVERSGIRFQVGFMRRYDPGYAAARKRVEAGEIGEPLIFRSIGRDKEAASLAEFQSGVNGMLFYANSIHDFDLARWLMGDEVREVHTYATCLTWPELADCRDALAGTVNLSFEKGAIGNVESCARALYGYDVRTEVVGSKGAVLVGTLFDPSPMVLSAAGAAMATADHFLTRFADAYVLEARDFVHNVLHDKPMRVSGQDGLAALAMAVAAEKSYVEGRPVAVGRNEV